MQRSGSLGKAELEERFLGVSPAHQGPAQIFPGAVASIAGGSNEYKVTPTGPPVPVPGKSDVSPVQADLDWNASSAHAADSLASRREKILRTACENSRFVVAEFWELQQMMTFASVGHTPSTEAHQNDDDIARRRNTSRKSLRGSVGSFGKGKSFVKRANTGMSRVTTGMSRVNTGMSRVNTGMLAPGKSRDPSSRSPDVSIHLTNADLLVEGMGRDTVRRASNAGRRLSTLLAGRRRSSEVVLDDTNAVSSGSCLRLAAHYVQPTFFDMACDESSVYHKKGIAVAEKYEVLTTLNFAASPIRGEGLEGSCLERGRSEATILSQWIANPEMQLQDRYLVCNDLYAGAVAVPVWGIRDEGCVGVLVLYLPRDSNAGPADDYIDLSRNTRLKRFAYRVADMLALDLEWGVGAAALEAASSALTADVKKKAQQMWRKIRVLVMTGWLRTAQQPPEETAIAPLTSWQRLQIWFQDYTEKWKGQKTSKPPPRGTWSAGGWTLVGSFLGILLPSVLHSHWIDDVESPEMVLMIGSYGALATLLFGAPASPFAQPRMVFAGHLMSTILAISCDYFVDSEHTDFVTSVIPMWVALALIPAICICCMVLAGFTHPPAAACAFIYVAGAKKIKEVGWLYIVVPSLMGSSLMVLVALIINNLSKNRRYPTFW